MPFNKQFAFVFTKGMTDANQIARSIAHEVAHGTFNLRHTFSTENRYMLSEGTTDNRLDYNGGTALYKYQWDLIHDPEKIWFAWMEEEEEGEMASGKTDAKITFSKLEDTDIGNRYGYDDMGTPTNPDDDHVSVKNEGGYTYVKVEIDGKISGKKA